MKLQLKIVGGATQVKINGSVMEVGHIVADIFFALFFIGKEKKINKEKKGKWSATDRGAGSATIRQKKKQHESVF